MEARADGRCDARDDGRLAIAPRAAQLGAALPRGT